MNKFLIKESEKEEIRAKHLEFKNILEKKKGLVSEQNQPLSGDQLIEKAHEVCGKLKSGTIRKINNKKVIKIIADTDAPGKYSKGDVLFFKSDMTCDVYDSANYANGNYQIKKTFSWSCSNLSSATTPPPAPATPTEPVSTGIKSLGDWTDKKPADYDLNPGNYDTKDFGGVKYYRNKTQSSYVNPDESKYENQDQKDYIEKLTENGYSIKPSVYERSSMIKVDFESVDPESKGLFPQGLTVYLSRTGFEEKDEACKTLIDTYWKDYLQGLPYKTGAIGFNKDKAKVQYCVNAHPDNKWPGLGTLGIGGGEKDLQMKVRVLKGDPSAVFKGKGAPQGENKVFKLK